MLKGGKSGRIGTLGFSLVFCLGLAGCGESPRSLSDIGRSIFSGFGSGSQEMAPPPANPTAGTPPPVRVLAPSAQRGLLGGLRQQQAPGSGVNAHLWAASLDILGHLPIVAANPRTGRIETGYGTAPGSGRAYRAVAVINSGVLDATSLELSLYTRSGPAPAQTAAEVADAIFARARQLRMSDD